MEQIGLAEKDTANPGTRKITYEGVDRYFANMKSSVDKLSGPTIKPSHTQNNSIDVTSKPLDLEEIERILYDPHSLLNYKNVYPKLKPKRVVENDDYIFE